MSVRPGHSYRAVVRVGATTWDVTKGDPATFGPMLPLTVGWKLPDDGTPLPAPEPATCALSLILPSSADAAAWDIGTSVFVQVFMGITDLDPVAPTDYPSVLFAGRIAQLEGSPRRVNGTDAYQLDLTCVDYTADLGELEVAGSIPFQGVGVATWVDQLFQLAGLESPDWTDGGFGCAQLTLDGGKVEPSSLYGAVERLLSSYADGGAITYPNNDYHDEANRMNHDWWPYQGWRRGMISPVIDTDTGELSRWAIKFYSRLNTLSGNSTACTFPLVLQQVTGGKWDVRMAPVPAGALDFTQVLDAAYVDFGATWKRTKNTTPTRVIVANNTPADTYVDVDWSQMYRDTTEQRPLVSTRVTEFMGYLKWNAAFTAEMLLPDVVPYRDVADGFTYYASADPSWPVFPSWFPQNPHTWYGFSLPIVIKGIPDSQNPGPHRPGVDWYAGTLGGVVFTLEPGGTYRYDLTLRPGAPMPGGIVGSTIAWSQLQVSDLPGTIKPTDLEPKLLVHDLRLVRQGS